MDHAPDLVAHRGYRFHYPENTLIGVEAAILAGARYVEVDVQLSADRVPVLFHDRTLERVCGVQGSVHEKTLAQLKTFSAHEFDRFGYKFVGTPIASLSELCALLARHRDVTVFVEVKLEAIERFGVSLVLETVTRELEMIAPRAVLISFSLPFLQALRPRWPALGAVITRWRDRNQTAPAAPDYIFCDLAGLPRFGRLRSSARLAVYEVDDPALALGLARRGVALIETFAVGEMRAGIELLIGGDSAP